MESLSHSLPRTDALSSSSVLSNFSALDFSSASRDCGAQWGSLMEKKRVATLFSQHNVPLDVWSEILPLLPVKSLVRFRCVSKSWQSLIEDPDFCQLHLNRFKNNSNETHLIFAEGLISNSVVIRCSETFNTTERLGSLGYWDISSKTIRSTATPGYDGSWNILFTLDGLLLLTSTVFMPKYELMLWNPSIRKCRLLPKLPDIYYSDMTIKRVELGLGFDSSIKDYKVVRAILGKEIVCSIAIYTVGTGSWKTVQFQHRGPSKGMGLSDWSWNSDARESVYFRGSLYFVSTRMELVSFDLTSEVFTSAKLPAYEGHFNHSFVFVDGGSSLAVFCFSPHQGSIWALENSNSNPTSLCWTKRCRFTTSLPCFFFLKKDGDLLLRLSKSCELESYDIETQARKLVPKTSYSTVSKVCSYKESLLLLI